MQKSKIEIKRLLEIKQVYIENEDEPIKAQIEKKKQSMRNTSVSQQSGTDKTYQAKLLNSRSSFNIHNH